MERNNLRIEKGLVFPCDELADYSDGTVPDGVYQQARLDNEWRALAIESKKLKRLRAMVVLLLVANVVWSFLTIARVYL